jgi:collagenase-like PrtC family protease
LINPMVLPRPVEEIGPQIIAELKQLNDTYGLADVTVSNLLLARRVRDALPELSITASVLMDVATPYQAGLLDSTVDRLVVPSRLMRNLPALQALRQSFPGRLRLIVNEGCLPGCPLRLQHFYEMAAGLAHPRSLCAELLEEKPWLRLIGSWVLPQHLSYYRALVDEFKLAGRVTLQDPARYLRVLEAYIKGSPLGPHEIGGGPASPVFPMAIEEEFYVQILRCGQRCDQCRVCQTFYEKAASGLIPLPNRACDENSN